MPSHVTADACQKTSPKNARFGLLGYARRYVNNQRNPTSTPSINEAAFGGERPGDRVSESSTRFDRICR